MLWNILAVSLRLGRELLKGEGREKQREREIAVEVNICKGNGLVKAVPERNWARGWAGNAVQHRHNARKCLIAVEVLWEVKWHWRCFFSIFIIYLRKKPKIRFFVCLICILSLFYNCLSIHLYLAIHIDLYCAQVSLSRSCFLHLFIRMCGYWSVCLFKYLSISLFISLSINPFIYLSICLSVCLSIYLSIYLSYYLSNHSPNHPSIHPSIYLSFYPSMFLSSISLYFILLFIFIYCLIALQSQSLIPSLNSLNTL